MTLASFLLGIVGTLAGRVLLSLGIGWISYAGITTALDAVRGHITSAWSVSSPVMEMLFMAGMGQAVGILLAGFSVRAAFFGISKLGKVSA
ncbi:DUF2523 domain-containing protein [Thiobacillus sp.]|uniref:DUF2523 domain-containing protein n=1 Tax=Thiobacillus sp. TaxID=924 RepID=UPI00286E2EE3|nr:DUF2523 domain-containing protein [Thiobacillus sp.]